MAHGHSQILRVLRLKPEQLGFFLNLSSKRGSGLVTICSFGVLVDTIFPHLTRKHLSALSSPLGSQDVYSTWATSDGIVPRISHYRSSSHLLNNSTEPRLLIIVIWKIRLLQENSVPHCCTCILWLLCFRQEHETDATDEKRSRAIQRCVILMLVLPHRKEDFKQLQILHTKTR